MRSNITIHEPYDWMIDERSRNKRNQTKAILRQLDFDVTHDCNKNCADCNLQISKSKFKGLTLQDFNYIARCIDDKDAILGIKFTGGEPLVNSYFLKILKRAMKIFPNASIMIHSNGLSMSSVEPDLFNQTCWRISEYPGWNNDIIKQYEGYPNVYIYRWQSEFFNPRIDPDLPAGKARLVRGRCMFSVRIIGRDLYGCCLSYPVELSGKCGLVHVPFNKSWQANWKRLKTWKACQHCHVAGRIYDEMNNESGS